MLNECKAAQVAAFFVAKAGGSINKLKLMKLMYLGDRKALELYDFPVTGDKYVSMNFGPVLSGVLNCLNGPSLIENGWDDWIEQRPQAHSYGIRKPGFSIDMLDELSEAELVALESVWNEHGHKDQWALAEYTHQYCSEWNDPHGSVLPISYESVFAALGRDNAAQLARRLVDIDSIDRTLAGL